MYERDIFFKLSKKAENRTGNFVGFLCHNRSHSFQLEILSSRFGFE